MFSDYGRKLPRQLKQTQTGCLQDIQDVLAMMRHDPPSHQVFFFQLVHCWPINSLFAVSNHSLGHPQMFHSWDEKVSFDGPYICIDVQCAMTRSVSPCFGLVSACFWDCGRKTRTPGRRAENKILPRKFQNPQS